MTRKYFQTAFNGFFVLMELRIKDYASECNKLTVPEGFSQNGTWVGFFSS